MSKFKDIIDDVLSLVRKDERYVTTNMGRPVTVLRENERLEDLEKYQTAPSRVRQLVTHADFQSFLDYLDAFKNDTTRVYIGENVIEAYIEHAVKDDARWTNHRSDFPMKHTPAADMWLKHVDATGSIPVSQVALALLFDRRAADIIQPDAATMQEIALTLSETGKVSWGSAVRLQNGDINFSYTHESVAKAGTKDEISIPETFSIGLALWEGSPVINFSIKLRWKQRNGEMNFFLEWVDFDEGRKEALSRMKAKIQEEHKVPCHIGMLTPKN